MASAFDARATTWDDQPGRRQMAADLCAALERRVALRPEWTVLDYGAGTGLLALALAPRVRRVTAVDSSAGMLEVLGQKARASGAAHVETLLADFSKDPPPPGPFDLVVSAMTLHHVADTAALLRNFFALLAPGGSVALLDLDTEDGSFHDDNHGIPHFGFDRDTLSRQLAAAGFAALQLTTATRIQKNSRTYPVFLAAARKP
jgi:2-polyprenyl-3-methyl-5-hydroxy-6-metoxy-1,4-benzoquinol methylase